MGGGDKGSNSSPPVDVAPGGGTYPVDITGTAYNPAWGEFHIDRSTLGQGISQGFQSAGQRLMGGAGGLPNFSTTPYSSPTASPSPELTAMQRFEPETGAGKYFYVDPKAGATSFDPMDYYNQQVGDAAATEALKDSLKKIGLLSAQESANPSF